MSKEELHDTCVKVGIGLGVGLLVGGLLGVLYAPKKGSETRKQIRDASGRFVNKAKEVVNNTRREIRLRTGRANIEDIKRG